MKPKSTLKVFLLFTILLSTLNVFAKSQNNLVLKNKPELYTVFNSGDDNVNSYRIPSIVVANDGSILIFGEARRESWVDKSRTDVVVKRSEDGGKTWSDMIDLTHGVSGAYMDPTPIVDKSTGEVFLFCNFWPSDDHSGKNNRSILVTSNDNGKTWNEPMDITDIIFYPDQWSMGFGPGNGIQMIGEKFNGRLIMPTRIRNLKDSLGYDMALYSDDHGKTWKSGNGSQGDREFQIAEVRNDTLIYNSRRRNVRTIARSFDGGLNWTEETTDSILPGVSRGCQASILRKGNALYFCGIDGIPETDSYDERANLALYKSYDGGETWPESTILYDKASGYTCMDILPDGRIAIIFEAGDTPGFTRKSIPGSTPPKRPEGWMRLDLMIIDE